MCTLTIRRQHARASPQYLTELTDVEWAVIAPLMPGYAGDRATTATGIAIVPSPSKQVGFAGHPRGWVMDGFSWWIGPNRRLWEDPKATLAAVHDVLSTAVMILVRKLVRAE